MLKFVVKRLAGGLVSLWVVSVLVFAATNLLPGDPAVAILGKSATPERVTALREAMNLDESVVTRYFEWLGGLVRGDFGNSLTQGLESLESTSSGSPVSELIGPALVNTAILATVALALLAVASVVIGTVSALRRGSRLDTALQVSILVFIALPEFVLGTILIIVFAFVWPVLPAVSVTVTPENLILPVATLVLGILGVTARFVRVGVIEVLGTNYVTNARLRGVPEATVIRHHVLPNALSPALQALAMATGLFIGGVVVIEFLFGYPGIGTGLVSAVSGRDYPVVQAYTLILAGGYIVANIVAETLTVLTNPRLREAVT